MSVRIVPSQSAIEWSTVKHSVRDPKSVLEPDWPDIEPPTEYENVWLIVPQPISDITGAFVSPALNSASESADVFSINLSMPSADSSTSRNHSITLNLPGDSVAGNPSIQNITKT